jgi:hypothetical protein
MNVEIGTEAAQFLEKKYINGIFSLQCGVMNFLHLHYNEKFKYYSTAQIVRDSKLHWPNF